MVMLRMASVAILVGCEEQLSVKGIKSLECGSKGQIILDRYFGGCIDCLENRSDDTGCGCWLGCTGITLGAMVQTVVYMMHHDHCLCITTSA